MKPRSGTTALLRYDMPGSSAALCRKLQAETGVMLLPGSTLEMEGWVSGSRPRLRPSKKAPLAVVDRSEGAPGLFG
jgi:hypothetical protein